MESGNGSWQSRADYKGQQEGMERQCRVGRHTFLEAAATFSRNSSTTSFSFCSSVTDDTLSPAFTYQILYNKL